MMNDKYFHKRKSEQLTNIANSLTRTLQSTQRLKSQYPEYDHYHKALQIFYKKIAEDAAAEKRLAR